MSEKNKKLILGTVQFGMDYGIHSQGRPSFEEIAQILDQASEAQITTLDTARDYGESESILGRYLVKNPGHFKVLSKFQLGNEKFIEPLLKKSLADLNIDKLDGYSFHSFDEFLQFRNWSEVEQLKNQGRILSFGASVYSNAQALLALKNPLVDFIQMPFNLLDNQKLRSVVIKKAQNLGKTIHTRSTYLQGLFFKPLEEITSQWPRLSPLVSYLQKISELAEKNHTSIESLAFNYPLSTEGIGSMVFGVDNLQQLNKNLDLLKTSLPTSLWAEIDKIQVKELALLNPSQWK